MIDYREIIRLKNLKFSNVAIANSLCCSRNTVSEVLKLAESHSLEWPIPETLTNKDIEQLFYPGRGTNEGRRLPDYEYIYNELLSQELRFLFYGPNIAPNVRLNIPFLINIRSSMKNIMPMRHQRKQLSGLNANREKPWKSTGSEIHLKCMILLIAAKYRHIFLLLSFPAACTVMQKRFLI